MRTTITINGQGWTAKATVIGRAVTAQDIMDAAEAADKGWPMVYETGPDGLPARIFYAGRGCDWAEKFASVKTTTKGQQ